jgi:hypothetical protein
MNSMAYLDLRCWNLGSLNSGDRVSLREGAMGEGW